MRRCAISGCTTPPILRRHHLCSAHYHQYGKLRPAPAWLRALINASEREQYFIEHHGWRFSSLEKLLEKDDALSDYYDGRGAECDR